MSHHHLNDKYDYSSGHHLDETPHKLHIDTGYHDTKTYKKPKTSDHPVYHEPIYPPIYVSQDKKVKKELSHVNYGKEVVEAQHVSASPDFGLHQPHAHLSGHHMYQPKSYAELTSKYYTHTPKPEVIQTENSFYGEGGSHALYSPHHITGHSLPTYHRKIHRHDSPESHKIKSNYVHKAIGDVKAEFKKGYQTFDHKQISNHPTNNNKYYPFSPYLSNPIGGPLYKESLPYVRSYGVQPLPPPVATKHNYLSPVHHPIQYPQGLQYKIHPTIDIGKDLDYQDESYDYNPYSEKVKEVKYVPPPPSYSTVNLGYHRTHARHYEHIRPVSKSKSRVSNHPTAKYEPKTTIFSSFFKYQTPNENTMKNRDYTEKLTTDGPVSFVVHNQGFPDFAGPNLIKIEIKEKILSHFDSDSVADPSFSPFAVPETKTQSRRTDTHNSVMEEVKQLKNERTGHSEVTRPIKSNELVNNTDHEESTSHQDNNQSDITLRKKPSRSTPVMNLTLPGSLNNNKTMHDLVSEITTEYKDSARGSMQEDLSTTDKSEEIFFIVVNDQNETSSDSKSLNTNKMTPEQLLIQMTKSNSLTHEVNKEPSENSRSTKKQSSQQNKSPIILFPDDTISTPKFMDSLGDRRKLLQLLLAESDAGNHFLSSMNQKQSQNTIKALSNSQNSFFALPDSVTSTNQKNLFNQKISQTSDSASSSQVHALQAGAVPRSQILNTISVKNSSNFSPSQQLQLPNSNSFSDKGFTPIKPNKINSSDLRNFSQRFRQRLKSARQACQCDLAPKLEPRRKFPPRFVNATGIVDMLNKFHQKD